MTTRVEHKHEGGWVTPVRLDDWGNVGWYLSAVKTDLGTWNHAMQDSGQRLKAGQSIQVRWPDGTVTHETLAARRQEVTVHNMGSTYTTTSEVLCFVWKVHGVLTEFRDLSLFQVKREGT